MTTTKAAFAAVYLTEGREWIDTTSIHVGQEAVRASVKETADKIPAWAKVNVFQRVAKVMISEIHDI